MTATITELQAEDRRALEDIGRHVDNLVGIVDEFSNRLGERSKLSTDEKLILLRVLTDNHEKLRGRLELTSEPSNCELVNIGVRRNADAKTTTT